jgi:hypothetical protein
MWERADLSRDAKVLFAFLCSCPGGDGLSGIIRIPTDDIRDILGWSPKKTAPLFIELERVNLVVVEGRRLWICDRVAMTPGFSINNAKHLAALETALADAPPRMVAAFRARYLQQGQQPERNEHSDEPPNEQGGEHGNDQPNHGNGDGRRKTVTDSEDGEGNERRTTDTATDIDARAARIVEGEVIAPVQAALIPYPKVVPAPKKTTTATAARMDGWSGEAGDIWGQRMGGTIPYGEIGKHLKPLVDVHGWENVRPAWYAYLAKTDPNYASAATFAKKYGVYSGGPQAMSATELQAEMAQQQFLRDVQGGR